MGRTGPGLSVVLLSLALTGCGPPALELPDWQLRLPARPPRRRDLRVADGRFGGDERPRPVPRACTRRMVQRIAGQVHLQLDPDGTLYAWQPRERRYLALSLDELALLQAFGAGRELADAVDGAGFDLDAAARAAVGRLRERGYLEPVGKAAPDDRAVATRYFEDQADRWLEGAYQADGRGALRLRTTLRALAEETTVAAPLRVLDLGCGAGQAAIALARRGHGVVALDRSEAMLAQARRLLEEQPAEVRNLPARGR